MFDIESKKQDEIILNTKKVSIAFDVSNFKIDANLGVGKIAGPGEFEIGDATIRGISVDNEKTIYDIEIGGVHIGIIGGTESGLDELGVSDILCTSSVRAIREIEPKVVIAMGNIDGMVSELKLSARVEKKYKVKNFDSLPATLEVISLG